MGSKFQLLISVNRLKMCCVTFGDGLFGSLEEVTWFVVTHQSHFSERNTKNKNNIFMLDQRWKVKFRIDK